MIRLISKIKALLLYTAEIQNLKGIRGCAGEFSDICSRLLLTSANPRAGALRLHCSSERLRMRCTIPYLNTLSIRYFRYLSGLSHENKNSKHLS